MKIIVFDCERMTSKTTAHEYISQALDFPMYYGKNLDALADCLSEVEKGTVIVLKNIDKAREMLGDYAERIIEVFRDISQDGVFDLIIED